MIDILKWFTTLFNIFYVSFIHWQFTNMYDMYYYTWKHIFYWPCTNNLNLNLIIWKKMMLSFFCPYNESQWDLMLFWIPLTCIVWAQTFLKISSLMFHRAKKVVHIWNNMRMIEQLQFIFYFFYYLFNLYYRYVLYYLQKTNCFYYHFNKKTPARNVI